MCGEKAWENKNFGRLKLEYKDKKKKSFGYYKHLIPFLK